ncbi:DUF3482 domain-containing protein, partial [Kingella kingae]
VFNFTHGQDLSDWQAMLAKRSLHVVSRFDTVAFDFDGEMKLWDNLATMLQQPKVLAQLADFRRAEWQRLNEQARDEWAKFLLDVAACVRQVSDKTQTTVVLNEMQAAIRAHESSLQQQLFALY